MTSECSPTDVIVRVIVCRMRWYRPEGGALVTAAYAEIMISISGAMVGYGFL
jgi:hypothetical protein